MKIATGFRAAGAIAFFLAAGSSSGASLDTPEGYADNLLDVKFREGTVVRLRGGVPTELGDDAAVKLDLSRILESVPQGVWDRTHSVDEAVLDHLRAEGRKRSTRRLADLNNYFRLQLPPGMTAGAARAVLGRFPSVEAAYWVPLAAEPPVPPDYSAPPASPYQDYLDPAPNGIDARNAWSRGWNGAGVKVCDVEYYVNRSHLDLPPVKFLGYEPIDPFHDDHGTAVMGIVNAKNDGVGTKGIAWGATESFLAGASTAKGYNVQRALMECAAALSAGDVLLIEQQLAGPYGSGFYVPTEWSKPVYDAIVTAVANGIVVVETTGNGGQNLDDPVYSQGNDEHWPFLLENDSGALLVTGGQSPHQATPRSYHPWSNYGATVDVQGWGDSIVTTGRGDLHSADGANYYYTATFGGSSGAGPMVVGAVAILQQAYKARHGTPAPPALIKQLLVSTGTPQTGSRHLGPLPDLEAALDALDRVLYVDDSAGGFNDGTSWANAYREIQDALYDAAPGTTILVAEGTYWPDWDPVGNFVTGDRSDSMHLKNGVTILGGYPNGGGTRDPDVHPSILTGDIGTAGVDTDNSYHVVSATAGIDDSAVLDGFTIHLGRADGAATNDRGAGVFLSGASPVLRRLRITSNQAGTGAGIYNDGSGAPSIQDTEISSNVAISGGGGGMRNSAAGARLTDVRFLSNTASSEGGGMFIEGSGTPHLERVQFIGNAGTRGGGLSHWPGASTVLDSVLFRGNQATADIGGAILNWQGSLRLNNVTMSGNTAPSVGGGIYLFDADTVKILNSILWGNPGGSVSGAAAFASYSIIEGGYPGTGVSGADPLFRVPGTDLRVLTGSPAIDTGAPGTVDRCAATDLRGVFREDACDRGAYEYRGNPGNIWTNGEVDLIHVGESHDSIPIGWAVRQSADDFIVPEGMLCDVTAIRGVLQDGSKVLDAKLELYGNAAGVPGSPIDSWTNAGTGQSLGYRGDGKLWEPNFTGLATRLGSGTYWASIYGTVEPESTGSVWAVSANEGAVRSDSYRFREVGFSWVDGGPYHGDVSRDLALEVDGACLTDADGDLFEEGVDCDDTEPSSFPGNPEICDGIDNDCDLLADSGAPPIGSPALLLSATELTWSPIAGAQRYDIVRGSLNMLRSSGGDFGASLESCLADEVVGTTYPDSSAPAPGQGMWYLVRPTSVCGAGSYDESGAESRDAEIDSSALACP